MDLPISRQILREYKAHYHRSFGAVAGETIGKGVVLRDPAGNEYGLIELHEHAETMFKAGKHRTHLRHVSSERLAIHSKTVELGKKIK